MHNLHDCLHNFLVNIKYYYNTYRQWSGEYDIYSIYSLLFHRLTQHVIKAFTVILPIGYCRSLRSPTNRPFYEYRSIVIKINFNIIGRSRNKLLQRNNN